MNIYVGNLSFSATEEDIRSLFEPFGQIERVQLITDRDSGQSRGFGFVEMPDNGQAEAAINALNGKEIAGRALSVNEARPRPERPRGGGGGRDRDRGGGGRRQRW